MNFELKYVIDTPAQKAEKICSHSLIEKSAEEKPMSTFCGKTQPSSLQVAVLFCEPWKSKIIKMIVPGVGWLEFPIYPKKILGENLYL